MKSKSPGKHVCFWFIMSIAVVLSHGNAIPQREDDKILDSANNTDIQSKDLEAMVPVSSTVIPVSSIFGNPKPEAMGTGELFPYFPAFAYSRRSRFFEKSSKPDFPVRLITKNSKFKGRSDGNE